MFRLYCFQKGKQNLDQGTWRKWSRLEDVGTFWAKQNTSILNGFVEDLKTAAPDIKTRASKVLDMMQQAQNLYESVKGSLLANLDSMNATSLLDEDFVR